MFKLFRTKIAVALSLMIGVLLLGMVGYKLLSDFSWVESLYMTIITVTTVGFAEVRPLDTTAKLFTVFLIITSVFIFGYAITVITEYLLERNALQSLRKRKVKKIIQNLSGHVIVCGYGRNGQQAVQKLNAYNQPYVVIEKDREVIERFQDEVLFIEGDANEDEVLLSAGLSEARYLITAVPDDAINLFIVLTARQLNEGLFIISRASQQSSIRKLEFAGADQVIMPDKLGGDHMASLVVMPDLITFMDKLSIEGKNTTNLEEVEIAEFADQIVCNTLRDLDLRNRTGCTIIGYISPSGEYIINPEADQMLETKGKVIVLGRPDQIEKLNIMFRED